MKWTSLRRVSKTVRAAGAQLPCPFVSACIWSKENEAIHSELVPSVLCGLNLMHCIHHTANHEGLDGYGLWQLFAFPLAFQHGLDLVSACIIPTYFPCSAASAILRDWQVHNEPSPLSGLKHNMDLEDTAWTASLASDDSLSSLSQAPAFTLFPQRLDPGESHFTQDALSSSIDWERSILGEKHESIGGGARCNGKYDLWSDLDGGHQEEASPLGSEHSSQAENRAPSRWQYPQGPQIIIN